LNTSGEGNVANGRDALHSNTDGDYNVANGQSALFYNTTGSRNVANGLQALLSNTSGNKNVANGYNALYLNSTGTNNTAMGAYAGRNNMTGDSNVFIGNRAGYNETGSNKLYIANSPTNTPLIGGDFYTQKVTINGNVGIGNANPDTKVVVQDAANEQLKLYNPNNAVGSQAGMYLQTSSGWSVELRTSQENSYLELFGNGAVKHRWYDVNYYPGNGNVYITGSGSNLSMMGGSVGIGTATPAASAILEVSSTTKGFLPPKMTQTQRNLISPEEGLIIYNLTTKKPNYYNGTQWMNYDGTPAL